MSCPIRYPGIIIAMTMTTSAAAYPGQVAQRTADVASPVDNFPGMFDAASLDARRWNLELLPVPALRYGLTDELMVGISATTLLTSVSSPTLSVDLRYRLWGRGRWASTLSLGAAYGNDPVRLRRFETALTVERRASPRRSLALTIYAAGLHVGGGLRADDAEQASPTTVGAEGGAVMLSHYHFPLRWFGYQLSAGWAPRLLARLDAPGTTLDLDISEIAPVAGRLMVMFKPGPAWLIRLGIPAAPLPVPYLGLERVW
jgi:hypothetical protein